MKKEYLFILMLGILIVLIIQNLSYKDKIKTIKGTIDTIKVEIVIRDTILKRDTLKIVTNKIQYKTKIIKDTVFKNKLDTFNCYTHHKKIDNAGSYLNIDVCSKYFNFMDSTVFFDIDFWIKSDTIKIKNETITMLRIDTLSITKYKNKLSTNLFIGGLAFLIGAGTGIYLHNTYERMK